MSSTPLGPTQREDTVADEILAVLKKRDAYTWSLHGPDFTTPTDGYLVSAPLMSLQRRGVPARPEVLSWLELNRAELTSGDPMRWRRPIREHYRSYSPPIKVPATPHRAAHTDGTAAEQFFVGAWVEDAIGIAWLDVNIWYPRLDEFGQDNRPRAEENGRGWGQHSIFNLANGEIRVSPRRSLLDRLLGAWYVLKD